MSGHIMNMNFSSSWVLK